MIETKKEKFRRLATKRTNVVLDKLRLLGQLSNTATYEYEEEEVNKIFYAIDFQLKVIRAMFQGKKRREFTL